MSTAETCLSFLDRYTKDFSLLPGWFWPESAAIWDCLLTFQKEAGIQGNFLEIGVFCGKSASLSTLHARDVETCLFVDLKIPKEVRSTINQIKSENVIYSEMPSSEIARSGILITNARSFRWIHVDGEHSGPGVMTDLDIASELLSENGVIVIDDFFSAAYPQISAAVFQWLQTKPLRFQLFLVGYNKAYMCRMSAARFYTRFIKDRLHSEMSQRISRPLTVWKSTHPSDMNCFGIWERVEEYDYRGPDWDINTIQI